MIALVTGATGFTGGYVVRDLLEAGHQVVVFARPTSDRSSIPTSVPVVDGDLDHPEGLISVLKEVDALVNIASLGFGHAPGVVGAAVAARVRRAIFVSTTAIFTRLNPSSKGVRLAAEAMVRASGLAATIVRPTMIFGSARDRNMSRLIRYLQRRSVVPIAGDGRALQQPVYVEDLSRGIVGALESDRTLGRDYNLAGACPLTYVEVLDTICELLGRRVLKMRVPLRPAVAVLRGIERAGLRLSVTSEQLLRLGEDKAFDWTDAHRDFGFSPRSFRDAIRQEIISMGLA